MTVERQNLMVGGRRCSLFCPCLRLSVSSPDTLVVQLVSHHQQEDLQREVELLFSALGQLSAFHSPLSPLFVAVPIADWELELMPWAEPAVSSRPEVGSGAGETLLFLTDELLPAISSLLSSAAPVVLGGYSLAGLFALWAACQTDRFAAVAAGSPSLWAGDWPAYAAHNPMMAKQVYLSLGDREERSRNKTFARVGDRIRDEYQCLQQQLGMENTTLVWEQGGHFADPAARMARAFVWCLETMRGER